MPLRLLEVTVPEERVTGIEGALDELPRVQVWALSDDPDRASMVRVLLDAADVEAVSDRLVERYGTREGFRLVLLRVEGTSPAVEEPDGEEEAPDDSDSNHDHPQRISREELYEDVVSATRLNGPFVTMVALSTVVAAVGLIRGDIAIVIGAMVIAPLLGPNMALALASTLGDTDLAKQSLKTIAAGLGTAAAISVILGISLDVTPSLPELASRTGADLGDIVLALSAGAAGSLAFTTGVPAVVVGVMVAVALLPPLVVAGLLAGAGFPSPALGALALTLTNVTCVNLAAVATFLVQRVGPRTWWETDRARRATIVATVTWIVMLAIIATLIILGYVDVERV